MSRPDFYQLIAVDRGVPDGWFWCSAEWVDNNIILKGAVCTAVFARGKRAGRRNWAKRDKATERAFVISPAELHARQMRWERETSKCHSCGGTGQELVGWSTSEGLRHRQCKRCAGTGAAPQESGLAVLAGLKP